MKQSPKKIASSEKELFKFIEEKIRKKQYIFTKHATQRQSERNISVLEILNILEGEEGYQRRWNRTKDTYEKPYINEEAHWKYCIDGKNIDNNKFRVIITFTSDLMLIITAMRCK